MLWHPAAVHPCSPKHLLNFSSEPSSYWTQWVLSTHLSLDFRSFATPDELKHLLPVALLFTSAQSHCLQGEACFLRTCLTMQTWTEKVYRIKGMLKGVGPKWKYMSKECYGRCGKDRCDSLHGCFYTSGDVCVHSRMVLRVFRCRYLQVLIFFPSLNTCVTLLMF